MERFESAESSSLHFAPDMIRGISHDPDSSDSESYRERVCTWANNVCACIHNDARMSPHVRSQIQALVGNTVLNYRNDSFQTYRLEEVCAQNISDALEKIFGDDRVIQYRLLRRQEHMYSYNNTPQIQALNLTHEEIAVSEIIDLVAHIDRTLDFY
jgi:hypothetical protein